MLDHLIASAVMIKYNDRRCHGKNLFTLGITWLVGIDHNNHRIAVYDFFCLTAANHDSLLMIVGLRKCFHHWAHCRRCLIDDNIGFLIQGLRSSINGNCRTKCIRIWHLMPHNDHFILGLHQLSECLCFDTRLYTRILFHLLGLTTVISNLIFRLHDSLISASCKSQIHGTSGIFHTIRIGTAAGTNTNT